VVERLVCSNDPRSYVTWNQAFLVGSPLVNRSEGGSRPSVVRAGWSTSWCEFRALLPDGATQSTSSLFSCGGFANLPASILHLEQGSSFPWFSLDAGWPEKLCTGIGIKSI